MKEPGDKDRFVIMVMLAFWALAVALSAIAFGLGQGPLAYLGWQGVAGMFAVAIFGLGLKWPKDASVRQMAYLPIVVALAHVVGLLAWRFLA